MDNVHFLSTKTEIGTPQDFFNTLNDEFHFTLDVCASSSNNKCPRYYNREQDSLKRSWKGEVCYMNPPYGRQIVPFIKKAYYEGQQDNTTVICLIPSRTDTRWWHSYVMKAAEIRFIQGRLTFQGESNAAPFPSAIVIFKRTKTLRVRAMTAGIKIHKDKDNHD